MSAPDFPHSDADSHSQHVTRTAMFSGWVGRTDRLLRLAGHIETALEEAYHRHVAQIGEDPGDVAAGRAGRALKMNVEVTESPGRMKHTGSLRAILDDLDPASIEDVTFSNNAYATTEPDFLKITLLLGGKLPLHQAVELEVSGANRKAVGGVFELLTSELRKSEPWWATLRKFRTATLLASFCVVGLFGWMFAESSNAQQRDISLIVQNLIVLGIFGVGLGGAILHAILRRVFPALEILELGESARGNQILAGLFAALSFLVGTAGLVVGVLAL